MYVIIVIVVVVVVVVVIIIVIVISVVKEMIRHGVQRSIDLIGDEDDDSNTPLHLACINGHYWVAKVLLDAEADPDARLVNNY